MPASELRNLMSEEEQEHLFRFALLYRAADAGMFESKDDIVTLIERHYRSQAYLITSTVTGGNTSDENNN